MARTITGMMIRERRRELGIKQVELARRVGISASYLNLIERNKRGIGGALLGAIGRELSLTVDQLDGSAERRLRASLLELANDPELGDPEMDPAAVDEFIARFPGWARGATRAHQRYAEAAADAESLSDRLAHDPALAEAIHEMLTEITALRSTAEILATTADIDPAQRHRFEYNMMDQSTRLSVTGSSLARYFDRIAGDRRRRNPQGDAEDLLDRRGDISLSLDAAAERLRATLIEDGGDLEAALRAALPRALRPNIDVQAARNERVAMLTNALVAERMPPEIGAILDSTDAATDSPMYAIVRNELVGRVADAIRLPAAGFLELGRRVHWNFEDLIRAADDDSALVFRRTAALFARGAPRATHLVVDASGRVLRRRGALDLMPRARDIDCPNWPVHHVGPFGSRLLITIVMLSGSERRLAIAGSRRRGMAADMLILDQASSADTVYAVHWQETPAPVGSTCRICIHQDCDSRREASVITH
ncbi:XRE family transcriptional regulator [Oceanibacterium hippocampi]|uniref:Helix-turn-helix protein n=1 Tax=Oceanibacterium hippocampi TaxID=745714 RepID=A0A1Y5TX09_9PROT|nr:XRE family transcriptional regulator [Oceanibacterium hippocampi]SLN75810.1 helix-turn-helix protein [Oceanibacterium hippocampi]